MVDIRFDVPDRLACCWACGRDENNPPRLCWPRPFAIENAHIIGGPGRGRFQDRREAVVLLCSRCHRLAHGDRIADIYGEFLPGLSRGNLIWLKATRDREFYSPATLAEWHGQRLPESVAPHVWFAAEWAERIGV